MLNLETFKPINNLVLLKPVNNGTERKYGKTNIILGTSNVAKNQYLKNYYNRNFEVIKVPEKLVFPKSRYEFAESGYAFRFRTEQELKEGDIVWVKLRSGYGAIQLTMDGETYFLVHYAEIFVAQRRNLHRDLHKPNKNRMVRDEAYWDIIPLNGNVICDKVYTKSTSKLDIKDKREEPGKLKVKYIGNPSLSYFTIINDQFREMPMHAIKLKHKDIIQADGPYINVEGEYFHDFNGESQPVTIHRSFIAATL